LVVTSVDPSDRASVVRRWFGAALEGGDVVATIAAALAARTGMPANALEFRLRHERSAGASDPLDAFASDPFLHTTCELVLEAALAGNDLWPAAQRAAQRFGGDVSRVPRAIGDLVGRQRTPAIAFGCDARSLPASAEFAARLVDSSPFLAVAVCTDEAAWEAYSIGEIDNHAKDLLREGLIKLAPDETTVDAQPARLRAEARRALEAARKRPDDEAAAVRLRSAAETLLYEALEANAYTRGQFEANRTLDVVFGTRLLEVDFLGRRCGIALELDGYYHFRDRSAYRRDRTKDILMQQAGYLVVRVLAEDTIDDVESVVSRIVALTLDRNRARHSESG
jgi:very-short-patch-repair endonuclease